MWNECSLGLEIDAYPTNSLLSSMTSILVDNIVPSITPVSILSSSYIDGFKSELIPTHPKSSELNNFR